MSNELFVCKSCGETFTNQESLVSHNRIHVKEEKISLINEFEVLYPETSNQSSNSDALSQRSRDLKKEPCHSSVQSATIASKPETSNQSSISNTLNKDSAIKAEPCHIDIDSLVEQSNATSCHSPCKTILQYSICNTGNTNQNKLAERYENHIKQDEEVVNNLKFKNYYTYSKTQGFRSCDICNLSFKTGAERKVHFRIHHCMSTRSCDVCNLKFLKLKKQLKHFRLFHKEKLVKCDVCSKGFLRNKDLKTHYKMHIGINNRGWYTAQSTSVKVEPMCKIETLAYK